MPGALNDVAMADELKRRPARQADYQAEANAVAGLAAALNDPAEDAPQALADSIVAMGLAGSAGVSLLSGNDGQCVWRAVSGAWRHHVGHLHSLDQTPCAAVVEGNKASLFRDPGPCFSPPAGAPAAREILMVPLHLAGEAAGSVWAVSHDDREFDREDARLLLRLGAVASAAYRLECALRQTESDRAEAVADLQRTRDRLGELIDRVPLILWRASETGGWTWAGPQWTLLTGQDAPASHGFGWLDRIHPDDRRRARRAWRLADGTDSVGFEYRVYDLNADRYRRFQARATPVRSEDGRIVEWLGTSTDIDDLDAARGHQRTLVAELQRRMRNTTAVVRSIARRTAENSDSLDDFQMHFEGRLDALARSQSLVTPGPGGGVDLETLIAEELLVHQAHEGERLTISGPTVRLKPKVAEVVGLAIHELTVNAVKYGGLSSDHGRVEINWDVEESPLGPMLALTWRDAALDRTTPQRVHHGFGSELIERGLGYDLDAATTLAIGPDGARCDIRLSLAAHAAQSAAGAA